MLEYLTKFKKLPPEIRESISSEETTKRVGEIEEKYGVDLATFVIRVAVGDVYFNNLAANLIKEFGLDPEKATALDNELKKSVFAGILEYLQRGALTSILPKKDSDKNSKRVDLSHLYDRKKELDRVSDSEKNEKEPKKLDLSHLIASKPKPADSDTGPEDKKENKKLPQGQDVIAGDTPLSEVASVFPNKKERKETGKDESDKKDEEKEEEEIKEFSKKSARLKKDEFIHEKSSKIADEVAKETGLSFASGELSERFKQVVATYIRGVRGRIDTRESLIKETTLGGTALDPDLADKILKLIDSKNNRGKENQEKVNVKANQEGTSFIFDDQKIKNGAGVQAGSKIDTRDVDYDLASVLKKSGHLQEKESVEKRDDREPESKKSKAKIEKKEEPASKEIQEPKQKFKKGAVLGEGTEKTSNEATDDLRKPTASTSSRRMDDIRVAPRTMGPADELRYMDLTVFRRFGSDPSARVAKVKEKIELLSKEGLEKRIEAIDAWRQSPVNRLYLNIGKQSISLEKSVENIIGYMKSENKDVLEREEFEAITDLNEELRF